MDQKAAVYKFLLVLIVASICWQYSKLDTVFLKVILFHLFLVDSK